MIHLYFKIYTFIEKMFQTAINMNVSADNYLYKFYS